MINIPIKNIKAVTICVNYSDYLEVTCKNKKFLDDWVIVTTVEDYKTIKLCEREEIKYIVSNRFYEDGDIFNKGKALNDGFSNIENPDWLLSLDADILLPNNFRNIHRFLHKKNYLYGAPRYTGSVKRLKEFFSNPKFSNLGKMTIPPMSNTYAYESWMDNRVIGYFQLFHYSDFDSNCIYPELYDDEINCNNAAFYDDIFSFNYRGRQAYIDNIKTIHLPHDENNWDGRVTQKLPYNILKDIHL